MEILVSRSEDLRSNWIKFICDQLGRIIFDKRAYLDDPKLLIILPKCDEAASKRKTDMDGDGFSDLMEMGIADSALRNNIAHLLYRATQLIPIEDIAVSRLRTVAEYVARWDSPNTYLADQQRFDLVSFGSSVSCIHPRIFLVNRLLSFPEARIRKRRLGLTRIGGYLEALETVWNLIEHCWVILASRHDCLHLDLGKTKDLSRFTILKGIARALAIEIEVAPDSALNACLVKTKRSTTIYVDSGLNMWDRSFYIAHELAHYVLRHRTIDPSAEAHPQYIEQQHHQEQEADALADVMMHVTDGLYDLSRAKADPEAGESAPRTGTVFSDR